MSTGLPSLAAPSLSPAITPALWARRLVASAAAVPLLLLVAALALRAVGLTPSVIDWDESLYLLQAREWLRGGWPLVAVWDMHPVGAPAVFAATIALLGESVVVVRLLGALCVAATGWALFGMARAAGLPRSLGLAAGLAYAALSVQLGGLATNTELLFAPLVGTALLLALGAAQAAERGMAPGWGRLAAMGWLIGLALAIKPVAAPEGCLAFALLVLPAWRRGLLPIGRGLAMAGLYALCCAAPALLLALAYWLHGSFEAWLDGSFLAPFRYAQGRLPFELAWPRIEQAIATFGWPLLLALAGLLAGGWRRDAAGRLTRFALLWLAVASIAVAGPGLYYAHYFLIWLPPLSLLVALAGWHLAGLVARPWRQAAMALLVAAAVLPAWLAEAAPRWQRGLVWQDPPRQVAAFIRRELRPGETIFVANYQPVVYVLADAAVPTRFAFPGHLTGSYARVSDIDTDAEIARVLATRPRFIVVDRGWWDAMRPSAAVLTEAALAAGYHRAAVVAEGRGPVEIWRRN